MNDMFNEDYLIKTSAYKETMNTLVLPWLREKEHVCMVAGSGNRSLYCVCYKAENPVGTVVIVHGFTENAYKYAELICSLLHLHFSVITYDQRGHGRSWRDDGVPDSSVTHVDHFSEYVEDLHAVIKASGTFISEPLMVFGHSMGGAVVSLFLEQNPEIFHAAVLSSPMIAPYTGGLPVFVSSALAHAARLLGRRKKKPFFMKTYSGHEDFSASCATDPERFAWYDDVKAANKEFQNSVPSYQWVQEAMLVTSKILAPGMPERITCPVLLFAADRDFSVLPEPQKKLITRISQGHYVFVRNSRHEIYRSTNDVLFPWWHQVIGFYQQIAGKPSRTGG